MTVAVAIIDDETMKKSRNDIIDDFDIIIVGEKKTR